MKFYKITIIGLLFILAQASSAEDLTRYVNPFIGTTNYGTTNPGAVCPNGMMSVVPFNVMGSAANKYDKDAQWWSTPYDYHNKYLTGFSHVNLSGVGCPELGSLLLMATSGKLSVDYKEYGSFYFDEYATPGYYTNTSTKYGIKNEVTATMRSSVARFTFPEGQGNILINLGEGLANESGAYLKLVNNNEVEGMKLLGTFCYNAQAVFPIYFVMRVKTVPTTSGYWKKQRPMVGVEAEWDKDAGKYKLYTKYRKGLAGDDVGAYFTFNIKDGEQVEVQMGVSFVSIENARLNLDVEQKGKSFDQIRKEANRKWNNDLARIVVEGCTDDQKTIFYTSLYHILLHPNIIQDVNGEYPAMESDKILTTPHNRYTVFSLWDTYRNVHQFLSLVYPERQLDMVRSMVGMYKESGWLPKWELYGRETLTMEGDPAIPVIVDTWMKGLTDFDITAAYQAMYKSATTAGAANLLRPENDDYIHYGYLPLRGKYDNSVSQALELYVADYALSVLAGALGKKDDATLFFNRSLGYKNYYCPEFGTLRPMLPDGKFLSPFNPKQGENFEPVPGFHEGSAWNYTFAVPHDIPGLIDLMGGKKSFLNKLNYVFDNGLYDPANEPDIHYPYLYSYFKGEEWRTQKKVTKLLNTHFKNAPNGIPGNDDTGTMSCWAAFSMMGFYPDCAGSTYYTFTKPAFEKITIHLDKKYYKHPTLQIENRSGKNYVKKVELDGKPSKSFRIKHCELVNSKVVKLK